MKKVVLILLWIPILFLPANGQESKSERQKALSSQEVIHSVSGSHVARIEQILTAQPSYSNDFNAPGVTDFVGTGFSITTLSGFQNAAIHSDHPYPDGLGQPNDERNLTYQLLVPIILNGQNSLLRFDEIALIEPGEPDALFGTTGFYDYVVVEGSRDEGKTWQIFASGYDAQSDPDWLETWNSKKEPPANVNSLGLGTPALYRPRLINLLASGAFKAGETVLIRFRLFIDPLTRGWGWAIDNLQIQAPTTCTLSASVTAGGPTNLCNGGSVTLNANTGPNLSYQWKRNDQTISGATQASYRATQDGNYTVLVSQTGTSCIAPSPEVGVNVSTIQIFGYKGNTEFCTGSSTTFSLGTSGGRLPLRFDWKKGDQTVGTGSMYTATTSGQYSVAAIDAGGCSTPPTSIIVRENPKPQANIGPGVFRSGTEKLEVSGPTASGGTPGYTYAWKSDPTVPIDNATASNPTFGPFTTKTNLILSLTDSKGCSANAQALVVYTENPVCTFGAKLSAKGYFCVGGADTLSLQLTGGSSGYAYLWTREGRPVSEEARYRVTQPGTYTAIVTDSKGCKALSDRVILSESPRPSVSISGADSFCKGSGTALSANATGGIASYTFQWKFNNSVTSSNAVLTATAAGTYTVAATDSRGCTSPVATTTVREKGGDLTALISPAGATDVLSPATVTLNASSGLGLAYQWRKDGQDIAGATAVSYVVTSGSGSFSVAVSRDGCSVVSSPVAVVINVPTALDPVATKFFDLHVFPNPTSGLLRVEIHLPRPEALRLSLQDLTGRRLTEQRNEFRADHIFELNLGALANGLYLLSAESESGRQSRKVLKSN